MTSIVVTGHSETIEVESPIILHAPHGSKEIPRWDRNTLTINDVELGHEILAMTDSHTEEIVRKLSSGIPPHDGFPVSGSTRSVYLNRVSRLVFDPERFPDEREEMNAVGMGFRYTHGSQRQRIRSQKDVNIDYVRENLFIPYAQGISELVQRTLDRHGKVVIVDIHSYASLALPYEMHRRDDRPEICLGTDAFHTPEWMVKEVSDILKEGSAGYTVGINEPFAGTYVPLDFYGRDERVQSIMLEIRRDTYMDESTGTIVEDKFLRLMSKLDSALEAILYGGTAPFSDIPTEPHYHVQYVGGVG